MWTEAELDECQSAAEQYAEVLFKAMRKAGVLADETPEELRSEIKILDRYRSKDCGYAYAPAVLCEMGDLDLMGSGFEWQGTYYNLTTPQGFSFEPYTSYTVNVFPDPDSRSDG